MFGPDRAPRQPGWRALPGDVLYAGGQLESRHSLPRGFYVLVGQRSDEEVLLREAVRGEDGAWRATDPGGVVVVRRRLLDRMVTTGVRIAGEGRGSSAEGEPDDSGGRAR